MPAPAARLTDMHTCPMVTGVVPHAGGPISGPGCPTVLIGGLLAARAGDLLTCTGPPDVVAQGSTGVFIGGQPAARMGDMTGHGGVIAGGCPTVLIGDSGGGAAGVGGGGPASRAVGGGRHPAGNAIQGALTKLSEFDEVAEPALDRMATALFEDQDNIEHLDHLLKFATDGLRLFSDGKKIQSIFENMARDNLLANRLYRTASDVGKAAGGDWKLAKTAEVLAGRLEGVGKAVGFIGGAMSLWQYVGAPVLDDYHKYAHADELELGAKVARTVTEGAIKGTIVVGAGEAGAEVGGIAGAAIGTALIPIPVVGTAIGYVAGSFVGSLVGADLGSYAVGHFGNAIDTVVDKGIDCASNGLNGAVDEVSTVGNEAARVTDSVIRDVGHLFSW